MPASLPPAADLLAAARAYLEGELLPTLSGAARFKTRVIVNVLAQVQRELEQGPALRAAEAAGLRALLGEQSSGVAGATPPGTGDRPGTVDEAALAAQNRELARRIRAGAVDADDPALIEHLRRTTVGALRLNNPKWLRE